MKRTTLALLVLLGACATARGPSDQTIEACWDLFGEKVENVDALRAFCEAEG